MKFELEMQTGNRNLITAYCEDGVTVGDTIYRSSIIVSAEHLVPDWAPATLPELTAAHWDAVVAMQPEILLFGTGARLQFPEPHILAPLLQAGISYEVMDTPAACRTYNLIAGDGRRVAAALLSISCQPD